jgi:hypothetical protein
MFAIPKRHRLNLVQQVGVVPKQCVTHSCAKPTILLSSRAKVQCRGGRGSGYEVGLNLCTHDMIQSDPAAESAGVSTSAPRRGPTRQLLLAQVF